MRIEIIGAESMGVRSLCCLVTLPDRRIVIDPGVALGYMRYGLPPHPLQIAVGRKVREKIVRALSNATDIVFSHFHGDHVPLVDANPYQLAVRALPNSFRDLCCWSKSDDGLTGEVRRRFQDLANLLGNNMRLAEGRTEEALSFSQAVPHGASQSNMGTVMMTRIEMGKRIFAHASDIQLLDDRTIDQVIDWRPDIVIAAGPPLHLDQLSYTERERAWHNAIRLTQNIGIVILDHHLMRSSEGALWLDKLSATVGKKVYCAADYMGQPRCLLEAERMQLYKNLPVPDGWHKAYAKGRVNPDQYLDLLSFRGTRK